MASAQEPSSVRFQITTPSGLTHTVMTQRVEALGPSGSADGVIASTPEKWLYVPINPQIIPVNSELVISVKLDAADGVDYSDCGIQIPFTDPNGSLNVLGNGDLTGADLAAATSVGVWHELASYTFTRATRFGGGKIFFSVEDDT